MGRPAQLLTPWTIFLVLVLAVLQALPAATEGSAALASARVCLLAGGVLDFYTQNTGLPQCLRNGLCPAGSVQADSQCVAPEEASGSREIGITMQLGCDMNCLNNEGVDSAAIIWLALSRLLRIPLQESHASLLMMSSALRERYPLEYFTLHISGEEQLQTLIGNAKSGMADYDLFLTVRIHTGRIGAAADELRQLLAGDMGNLAHISGASHETMHMFAMQERRSNGPVRGMNGLRPNFKIKGYNWNERPDVANPGPAPSPPKYSPPPPPAYTPAPPPPPTTTPEPEKGCSKDCQPAMIGDGRCDTECQNAECSWDAGDCLAPPENGGNNGAAVDLPGCGCEAKWLGNGKCETFCNYDACKFDGGDCASSPAATNAPLRPPAPAPAPRPTPAPPVCGCNEKWIGDGICDSYCNTAGCNYDGGDCPRPWNAPPAPPSPKRPAPPPYSNPVPAPVPAPQGPSPAAHSAPTPVPAAAQQPAPPPSPPPSPAPAPQTKVVDMRVEDDKHENPDSQEAAGWRIVGAREDGSTFYADGGGKSEDDEAGPFMTAAVIAIFFAATGLLAVTAICILVKKNKPPPSKHRAVTPKFNVFMDPSPGGVRPASQVPAFSTKASQEAFQQRSSSSSANGKKSKPGKASTYGRQQSKESSNSQETQSTTSTETPPSNGNGTPGSSCSGEHDAKSGKRWEKEPKVHPEPDPAPPPLPTWHRNSPLHQRPPEVQRGVSKDSPQRRHTQPPESDRAASKESPQRKNSKAAEVDRGLSKDSPQRPNPRTPEVDREASKEPAQQEAQSSPAQARRASAPPAPRQEPKVQPAAGNTGPRAAAHAESPPQPIPETNRGRQKAAGAASYSRWKFGLNSSSSSKASPAAEPSPKAKPPQRSQSSPPAGSGGSWFGGGASGPSKEEKAVAKKANSLSADMMHKLDHSRSKSLDERKKVFKDLQRQLHPDKNIEQAEAAKQAFQKLMEQRGPFLAS